MSTTTTTPATSTHPAHKAQPKKTPNAAAPKAESLTKDAAETLHNRLVSGVRDMLTARRALIVIVKEAQSSNLHKAQGFPSWSAYITDVIENTIPKSAANKAEREWLAVLLVHFGVSQRDAAKATDVSQPTVSRRTKATGAAVAEEVAATTGDKADATPSATITTKSGATVDKSAARGKGKEATPKAETKEATPKAQPKRSPNAVATDAAAVIVGAWKNLTKAQREEILLTINALDVDASRD